MKDLYSKYQEPTPYTNPELFAAIYTRRSMPNDNHSLDAQRDICIRELYSKNLLLYKVYSDEISAWNKSLDERPSFSSMLEDARLGLFKIIIVHRHDRLARNIYDWLNIQEFLKKHNMKIIFVGYKEYDPNKCTPIERITHAFNFNLAQIEPSMQSARTKTVQDTRRKGGVYSAGKPSYGYSLFDIKKDEKKIKSLLTELNDKYDIEYKLPNIKCKSVYIPDPNKVDFIRSIFDLYNKAKVDYQPASYICKQVNDMKKEREGKDYVKINSRKIQEIIIKPLYCGHCFSEAHFDLINLFEKNNKINSYSVDDDKLISAKNVVPIISKETWINSIIKWYSTHVPHNNSDKPYIFKDLLHCTTCSENKRKDNIYLHTESYYYCKEPDCFSMKREKLEPLLITEILDNLINNKKDIIDGVIDKKVVELKKSIREEKKKLNSKQKYFDQEFKELMSNYDIKTLNEKHKEFKNITKEIDDKVEKYVQQIDELTTFKKNIKGLESHTSITTIEENFKNNTQLANNMLKALVKGVYISRDNGFQISYKS